MRKSLYSFANSSETSSASSTTYKNPKKETKNSEAIIDEAINVFDELIAKINLKNVENSKQHFKGINQELEEKGRILIDKINDLS